MQVPSVSSAARTAALVLLELRKGKRAHPGHPAPAPDTWHRHTSPGSQDPGETGPCSSQQDSGHRASIWRRQWTAVGPARRECVWSLPEPGALCKLSELLCPPRSCTMRVSTGVHTAQLRHTLSVHCWPSWEGLPWTGDCVHAPCASSSTRTPRL